MGDEDEVDEEAFTVGSDSPITSSKLAELLAGVIRASRAQEGMVFTTKYKLKTDAGIDILKLNNEYASKIRQGLGRDLYVFDLENGGLHILTEKGKTFIKDARSNNDDIKQDYSMLYSVAKSTFDKSQDSMIGWG